MAFSSLPLSYCTNVHPCRSVADVDGALERYTAPVRDRCGFDIAAGLWLPSAAAVEAAGSAVALHSIADSLRRRNLTCYTLNAFPYGDFHSARVKENVYLPDWSDLRRADYTLTCAQLLAGLLVGDTDGSISTLPLGFSGFDHPPDFLDRAIEQLLRVAGELAEIFARTGKRIRLAIEPEPFCLLEQTEPTVAFFARLFAEAERRGCASTAREYLGVCYDVCHQAVEFEDAAWAVERIDSAGIRINKVQISCAIELEDPTEVTQRNALARFVEPRYLHQTMARAADGTILRAIDLAEQLVQSPSPQWLAARPWRVHFHVPVDAQRLGVLGTTRHELVRALSAIGRLSYAPHLEVETYTWPVLPGHDAMELVEGLAREMLATRTLIGPVGRSPIDTGSNDIDGKMSGF